MHSATVLTTPALLCRTVNQAESNRVVTLLTLHGGKLAAVARGARRSRRRFGAALDLFVLAEAELSLRPGGRLATLERFDPLVDFSAAIARDVVKVAHGSYLLELGRELWPAGQPEAALFALLVDGLRALAGQPPSGTLLRAFELQVLRVVGLLPALERCVRCGGAAVRPVGFTVSGGGIVCARCGPHAWPLGLAAHDALIALRDQPLGEPLGAALAPALQRELRELMLQLVQHHLGRRPRALDFLCQLAASAGG